jgi:hypothetical protein
MNINKKVYTKREKNKNIALHVSPSNVDYIHLSFGSFFEMIFKNCSSEFIFCEKERKY